MDGRWRVLSSLCAGFVMILLLCPPLWGGDQASAQDLLLSTDFAPVNRVDAIAGPVMTNVSKVLDGQPLADPPYVTKTGAGSAARGPQLLFAGRSATVWFVHYQVGRDVLAYHLLVLTVDAKGAAHMAGHLMLKERAWSVPNLKNIVRRGEFKVMD